MTCGGVIPGTWFYYLCDAGTEAFFSVDDQQAQAKCKMSITADSQQCSVPLNIDGVNMTASYDPITALVQVYTVCDDNYQDASMMTTTLPCQ